MKDLLKLPLVLRKKRKRKKKRKRRRRRMNRDLPLFYLNKHPILHENEGMDDGPHPCRNPAAAISTYYTENLCTKSKLPNYYQSQMSFVLSNSLFVNQSVPVNPYCVYL